MALINRSKQEPGCCTKPRESDPRSTDGREPSTKGKSIYTVQDETDGGKSSLINEHCNVLRRDSLMVWGAPKLKKAAADSQTAAEQGGTYGREI